MTGQTPRRGGRTARVRPPAGGRGARTTGTGVTGAANDSRNAPLAARSALAELERRHGRVEVRFIDDVGTPVDDGHYVTVLLTANGRPVEALVLTTENFYDCLAKVMAATLPSMGRVKVS